LYRLIGLQRRFVLADQRLLRVELLTGNRVLLDQQAVAREIELRVLEQGLVARQLPVGLLELHLERARIDLGQEIAGADKLPFLESQTHQLPRSPSGLPLPRSRRSSSPLRVLPLYDDVSSDRVHSAFQNTPPFQNRTRPIVISARASRAANASADIKSDEAIIQAP